MKKKVIFLLVTVMLVVFAYTAIVYATEVENTAVPTTTEGTTPTENSNYEITYNDIFELHEDDYEMDKLVDGNAFIMVNGDVKITGEINGSAYILANGTVEIDENGYVADALYVVSKNVKISGVAYDVYAATNNFETTNSAYITRDINVFATNVTLRGKINRNVNMSAGIINVKDENSSVTVGGNFNYTSGSKIEGLEEIVTKGEINYVQKTEEEEIEPTVSEKITSYAKSALTSIIYVLVVFFLIHIGTHKFNDRITNDLKQKGVVDFVIGILGSLLLVIIGIISIFVLFTEIGIPIVIIAWMLIALLLYISPAVLQIGILGIIEQKNDKIKNNIGFEVLTLAAISLCVWILKQIPIVGVLISVLVTTTGLGLIIRNIIVRETNKTEPQNNETNNIEVSNTEKIVENNNNPEN